MNRPLRILLQTTIPTAEEDWSIARFSLLAQYLSSLTREDGTTLCKVVARDRQPDEHGNDPVLSTLAQSDFDQLWLFAVDSGNGISDADCRGITEFRQQGGGMLATRDHMDLGISLCQLGDIGAAHFFHSQNPEPDPARHCIDDPYTTYISYPNYHSGRNGDCQRITAQHPVHPLLHNPESPGGVIEFLPAHPHEGAVGAPANAQARVIAAGQSLVTGRTFNIAVAFEHEPDEHGNRLGRAVAQSTFHHFCDYNWDVSQGCPSFVDEPPGNTMQTQPRALPDLKAYLRNLALWLSDLEVMSE
ncbi:MAG: hypothetical protein MH252_08260 [Thermosynechococcaceae cyanobacterium MS004]|nr:hypothetical protein [Thermosynechococcaceae cyanobacterium MS004]